MQIVFLLSLPRSGSTLLQRILASHSAISTISEPWLLLPLLYATRKQGTFAEYGHGQSFKAFSDLLAELPNGLTDYEAALRSFYMSLCEKIANQESIYFLDKTPRYTLIAEDLLRIFPDAKFIVLWRNPLAIIASMLEAWSQTHWNMHHFNIDLYKGLDSLVHFSAQHADQIYQLRYEDLVTQPENQLIQLLSFLGLPYEQEVLDNLNKVQLKGQLGDKITQQKMLSISSQSIHKWQHSISNILRKKWAWHYLGWIGQDRLSVMGYDLQNLHNQLGQTKVGHKKLFSDFCYMLLGAVYLLLEPDLFRHKLKLFLQSKEIYIHK